MQLCRIGVHLLKVGSLWESDLTVACMIIILSVCNVDVVLVAGQYLTSNSISLNSYTHLDSAMALGLAPRLFSNWQHEILDLKYIV